MGVYDMYYLGLCVVAVLGWYLYNKNEKKSQQKAERLRLEADEKRKKAERLLREAENEAALAAENEAALAAAASIITCPSGTKPMNGVCTAPVNNPAYFCPAGKVVNIVSGACDDVPDVTVDVTDADKELSFTNLNDDVCIPWHTKHSDGSEMYKRVNSKVKGQAGNVYDVARTGNLRWKLPIVENNNSTNYFLDEFSGPVYYKSTDSRPRWFGKQPLVKCPSATKYVIEDE